MIYFEKEPAVIRVPLAAIIQHQERHFCLVRDGESWEPRPISVGPNNNTHVIVATGLAEGEVVTLTPFRFIKRSELEEILPSLDTHRPVLLLPPKLYRVKVLLAYESSQRPNSSRRR